MSGLDLTGVRSAILSRAKATGAFDSVHGHEPANAPGHGLTVAVWLEDIAYTLSGLSATSVRVAWSLRIYCPTAPKTMDDVDIRVSRAAGLLFEAFTSGFTLGGEAADIDLLGRRGTGLVGRNGWLKQDGAEYRVFTLNVPIILNDVWSQAT